jgi:sarcosine/dimethylglycine N-methyltransferase
MKLYNNVERVYKELEELGKSDSVNLDVEELSAFDQLHYHGTDALDIAIKMLDPQPQQHILEIGSGIGGPARYLAKNTEAHITALELQADQNEVAESLSRRCGLTNNLTHICGDFLNYGWGDKRFDMITSWLALYHIPGRQSMLSRCHQVLKQEGYFFTEDLYARVPLGPDQVSELEIELYAMTMPSWENYQAELAEVGFKIVHVEEMSDSWTNFTSERLEAYLTQRDRHVRVHGEQTVDSLTHFYRVVNNYFKSGKLGGVRLCAQKI